MRRALQLLVTNTGTSAGFVVAKLYDALTIGTLAAQMGLGAFAVGVVRPSWLLGATGVLFVAAVIRTLTGVTVWPRYDFVPAATVGAGTGIGAALALAPLDWPVVPVGAVLGAIVALGLSWNWGRQ